MSCWLVCLSVCYTCNFVCLHISINIFMYIRNISRHDFLLKVVTKKLWKILQQKNIVKTGKKIGVKKKRRKFHSSLFLTPNIFFRSRLVWKEFSGPEKNGDRFSSPSFLFCLSDNPNIGKSFFPFFSLGATQKSI